MVEFVLPLNSIQLMMIDSLLGILLLQRSYHMMQSLFLVFYLWLMHLELAFVSHPLSYFLLTNSAIKALKAREANFWGMRFDWVWAHLDAVRNSIIFWMRFECHLGVAEFSVSRICSSRLVFGKWRNSNWAWFDWNMMLLFVFFDSFYFSFHLLCFRF